MSGGGAAPSENSRAPLCEAWKPHLILQVNGGFGDRVLHADLASLLALPQLSQLLLYVSHGDSASTRHGLGLPPAQGPGPPVLRSSHWGPEEGSGLLPTPAGSI